MYRRAMELGSFGRVGSTGVGNFNLSSSFQFIYVTTYMCIAIHSTLAQGKRCPPSALDMARSIRNPDSRMFLEGGRYGE